MVNVIAKHYDILKYLRYDTNDDQKPKDYNYIKNKNGDSPHKYIATAVEACIGEIYRQNKQDIKPIIAIAKKWIDLINTTPYNI